MQAVSTPTKDEIMATFHRFADRFQMACIEHGSYGWQGLGFGHPVCPKCRKRLVFIPEGVLGISEEEHVDS